MSGLSADSQTSGMSGRQVIRRLSRFFLALLSFIAKLVRNILILILFLAVLAILYFGLPILGVREFLITFRVLLILIGTILPVVIYNYFIHDRLKTLFAEYTQNLRRLGLPENAQLYQDKFEQAYGGGLHAGLVQFTRSPILVTTFLTLIGWILVFFPSQIEATVLEPNPLPIVYGFLGAYIFGLGSIIRQYVTDDLQIRYYASLSYRYITVFVLSWLILLIAQAGTDKSSALSDNYLVVAFVIGIFPTIGLRVAQRIGTAALGIAWEGFKEDQPLSKLDGLNAYHEDRLMLEGIEDLQSLSCTKLVDLMLKTRFPVEQVVDWIDQALLQLHTRDQTKDFLKCGLRTATDFLDFYEPESETSPELKSKRIDLAKFLNTSKIHLDAIASALLLDPNYFHIRYWRDHEFEALPEDVERHRTHADRKLMQGLPEEAIAAYDELLRTFPMYHAALLYRGMAYFTSGDYSRAIDDYTTAIRQGGLKWEGARHAYVEKGRALREMGEFEEAVENYQEALNVYQEFPEARFELAYVQMSALRQYTGAIEHFRTLLATDFRKAEVLANLGASLYQRWLLIDPSIRGVEDLEEARSFLVRAIYQRPDLIPAYINLAEVHREIGREAEALRVLTQALLRLETLRDPKNAYRVRLRRGRIFLGQGDLQLAAEDYEEAVKLDSNEYEAFFNLGFTLRQLDQLEDSAQALQTAIRLKPRHAVAHQELGDVAMALGEYEIAEEAYSTYLELMREDDDRSGEAEAHLSLGILYKRMDRASDSERELQQAIQMAGDAETIEVYTRASYELGLLRMEAGVHKEAINLLKTSSELFSVLGETRDVVRVYLNLGRIHLIQDDHAAALKDLIEAKQQLDSVFQPQAKEDKQLRQEVDQELSRLQDG